MNSNSSLAEKLSGVNTDIETGTGEILSDPRENGEERPWKKYKKLAEILRHNEIQSITVVRMEVPCCGGIEHAVKNALLNSGRMIPWQVVTIATDGSILE